MPSAPSAGSSSRGLGLQPNASSASAATTSTSTSLPRNPVRLAVAHRGPSSQINAAPSKQAASGGDDVDDDREQEVDALRRAEVKRVQMIRRVERWMDRLMEETVDRETFKRVMSHVTPPQYLEVAHERHLNSLCSYPLCPNPPARPYSTARRYVISTRARTIKPTEGNEEEGYCSKRCRARSTWVERGLSGEAVWLRSQAVEEIELLEELEEKGEFTWIPEKKPSTRRKATSSVVAKPPAPTGPPAIDSSVVEDNITSTPTARSSAASQPTSLSLAQPDNPVASLIANLTIHERPTPKAPPAPPFLKPTKSVIPPEEFPLGTVTPQPQPQPRPSSQPSPKPRLGQSPGSASSPRDSRRVSSSLMGSSTSQLAKSFVAASTQLGPVHLAQGGADSDGGGEDSEDKESDWEKEMGWGEEDDEMKALFEEARLAREMLEE
ncbi:hypothetical protein I317_01460 [Kwoniella heveanensis CBS 569]|nr:hypothetical protein I317_01460 [Kwoniella heveanensis CBS 569]